MSDYPDGITHVVKVHNCISCSGREFFAVSESQAKAQIEYLERNKTEKCTAKYTIVKV